MCHLTLRKVSPHRRVLRLRIMARQTKEDHLCRNDFILNITYTLDLIGTFAFAISGALVASKKDFDLFQRGSIHVVLEKVKGTFGPVYAKLRIDNSTGQFYITQEDLDSIGEFENCGSSYNIRYRFN